MPEEKISLNEALSAGKQLKNMFRAVEHLDALVQGAHQAQQMVEEAKAQKAVVDSEISELREKNDLAKQELTKDLRDHMESLDKKRDQAEADFKQALNLLDQEVQKREAVLVALDQRLAEERQKYETELGTLERTLKIEQDKHNQMLDQMRANWNTVEAERREFLAAAQETSDKKIKDMETKSAAAEKRLAELQAAVELFEAKIKKMIA